MATSEARIKANQANAALSTGPCTEQSKINSRANSLKHGLTGAGTVLQHGLTGAGTVLPQLDHAEAQRRFHSYVAETKAQGDIGLALAKLAAINSVRMERAADQQVAALSERVRQVEAEFIAPEGADAATAAQLKKEAVRIAMFDPSPEATLARKYEATAVRTFFRCLKELKERELREEDEMAKLPPEIRSGSGLSPDEQSLLGSILEMKREAERMDSDYAEMGIPLPPLPPGFSKLTPMGAGVDLPFTIGRPG